MVSPSVMPKFRTSRNLTAAKQAHFFLTGPEKRNLKQHSEETQGRPTFSRGDCSMGAPLEECKPLGLARHSSGPLPLFSE